MKIYRALATNFRTQEFGIKGTNPSMLEKYQSICRSPGDCLKAHTGQDWAAKDEEPLYWDGSVRGKVFRTWTDSKGGLGVEVITEEVNEILKHRFWHLKSFACKEGQILEIGDLIGYADNTGWSTGTHLHRDVKLMIKIEGRYEKKYSDNGFFGAINFEPMFVNIFALDAKNMMEQVSIIRILINLLKKKLNILKGR